MINDQQPPPTNQILLEQAIAFAGKYARTFDRELLDHWYRLLVEQTLPSTATHAELAANNAVRHFVVQVIRQYQLAITGSPNTPWVKTTEAEAPTTETDQARTRKAPSRKAAAKAARTLKARAARRT